MSHELSIKAAIFDMDGLLINSEPLWSQAEKEILSKLGVNTSIANQLPDTLGLRIDQVVQLWYLAVPWQGTSLEEVEQKIVRRVIELIEEQRPLLPGVKHALQLCQDHNLKIGLASASPKHILEKVLTMFNIRDYFSAVVSATPLAYSKPHPEVYLQAAKLLAIEPTHCVAFEDSFHGMIAVKAARMRSIVVPPKDHFTDPRWTLADVKLNTLAELTTKHIV
ncbi:hexitol phosphatase HxpB [Arsenophonus endosymbiont of Bemisia tabaci]|uniref:hexitol phosphatase HxpB n=1 Tax=Arsenophonus endosymbiont of Bemisia tabaci TaxID=536059 RepID=UPI0015F65908|nr:hexitol phosphatase HxpB [Arsenophonus endosymbiont of Bemisia tabaci]CAA2931127.1 2-deoxyglucose-6-phosphate phosphatase [Arsenophonus endosymbiont of Bemisia tabaci Q2]